MDSEIEEGGILVVYHTNGENSLYLGRGHLRTFNAQGTQTAHLGTNIDKDGMIIINNRYGEAGWAKSGKQ